MSAYKKRYWDGKIKLFSPATGEIYAGLLPYVTTFLQEHGYPYKFVDNAVYGLPEEVDDLVTPAAVGVFVKGLQLPHKVRDYQYQAIYEAMRYKRRLLLSPTASGKSLMIYALCRYFGKKEPENTDCSAYYVPCRADVQGLQRLWLGAHHHCHKVYGGATPFSDKDVIITTWQSIYKLPRKYFEKFGASHRRRSTPVQSKVSYRYHE